MTSRLTPFLFALAVASPSLAWAEDAKTPIAVVTPWLRASPKGASVAGGYATIVNNGAVPDRLVGASLPIAAKGEVHSMWMADGVMHMAHLDKGLPIAAGATVRLTPGGYHLMFLKPTRPLKEGETIEGSLTFEKAGTMKVRFAVGGMADKAAPGTKPPMQSGMDGMDMH